VKILLVVHYFAPHIGGMETVVLKQAQSLAAKGHEVTIATSRPQKKALLSEAFAENITVKRFRSVNIIENRFGVTFPIISPSVLIWFLREISRSDVVHIHDVFYMSSHMAALACWFKRRHFFMTQHVAMVNHPSKLVMLIQRGIYSLLGRLIFKRAVMVVAYNTNVRNFLLAEGVPSEKILLTYNGIDTEYFKPLATSKAKVALRKKYELPVDKPIALFVGRLVPKKGFDLVCKAGSEDYTTLIVGGGDIPTSMKDLQNVLFFGPASPAQLQDLYRASDVFVFPAIGEMLTLVMQEAMASGLPVVTFDDDGYKEYDIDRRSIKFVERDENNIASAIRSILSDHGLRQKMSEYSRQLAVSRFSWSKNYQTEYAIYDEQGAEA